MLHIIGTNTEIIQFYLLFLTKVGRLEVTDEEWQAEMLEDFETSGLIHSRGKRGILTKVPKGN